MPDTYLIRQKDYDEMYRTMLDFIHQDEPGTEVLILAIPREKYAEFAALSYCWAKREPLKRSA